LVAPADGVQSAEARICGPEWAQQYGGVNSGQQRAAHPGDSALPGDESLKPWLDLPGFGNWLVDQVLKWLDKQQPGFYKFVRGKDQQAFLNGSPLPSVQNAPGPRPDVITSPLFGLQPLAAAGSPSSDQAAGQYALGDFNGDGIIDSASFVGGDLLISLYGSGGQVLSTNFYTIGHTNGEVVAADFNGDGILDLAMVSETYSSVPYIGNVAIVLGHGDGSFGPPAYFQAGPNPISIAVADFNGDGKLDLVIGNQSGASTPGSVSILMGKGDGTFSATVSYNVGLTPLSMVSTDFNGDGKADLAVLDTSREGAGDTLYIFLGNADGTLRTPSSSNPGTSIGALSYTDLNHDGNQDLLISDTDGGAVAVLFGNGDGTFQSPKEYLAAAEPADVAVIPLPDGSTAILTADDVTGFVWLYFASRSGNVGAPPLQSVGTQPAAIATADLNHDGKNDIVITDSAAGALLVLLNTGNGQFANPASYAVGSSPAATVIADVNNDGKPDLITQDGNGIDVLLGKGDGTFGPAQTSSAVFGHAGFAIADFNSDGKPDLAFFNFSGDVSILLGNGNGTFSSGPTLSLAAGATPAGIVAGDFNNDGKQDLAVVYDPADSTQPGAINVLLGDGHGAFHSSAVVSVPGNVLGLNAAYLNHDGKLDLIARYLTTQSPAIAISLGKGDGTFQTPSLNATATGGSSIVVTDLNGDGNPDLLLSDGSEPSYMLGNGDGTFQPEFQFPSGPGGLFIAAADLNGDGKADLAIAGSVRGHGTLVVLINDSPLHPATPLSAGPASGTGTGQTFTFTFTDTGGYQNLKVVDVLINNALDGRHACYIAFAPSGSSGGSLFLIDDAGDAGGPYQGLVLPGSSTVSNGQCTINGAASSASGSGNTLTLTLAITFSASFSGNKVFYLSAQDTSSSDSGWQALGTWQVPGAQTTGPAVSGVSPPHTSSLGPTTYTFTFTDSNGYQDLSVVNVLINSAIDGRQACYVAFVPSGANAGSVFLVDDPGDAGGPYSGMVLPGTGTVSNSQCSITAAGSSVAASGNTLSLTLAITFNPSFAGNQLFFLAARSNTANSNWQPVGSVSVP